MYMIYIYSIITSIIMVYILLRISNIKVSSKKIIIFVLGYAVVLTFCTKLNIAIRQIILGLIFIEGVRRYFKVSMYKSIFSGVMGLTFLAVGDVISLMILHNILGYSVLAIGSSKILMLSVYLIIGIFAVLVVNAIIRLNKIINIGIDEDDIKKSILSITYIVITLIFIGLVGQIYKYIPQSKDKLYVTAFIAISFIFVFFNFLVLHINNRYVEQRNEFEQLKTYTVIVEDLVSDIRRFRHDYVNIISSISGFIENEDVLGLKRYFNNEILKDSKVLYNNNNMLELQNIKNPAIKGLISSKIMQAENSGINLKVEIINEVNDIPVNTLDLCKIIGILIDNGIEASEESNEKILNIGIMEDKEYIVFVILNSYKELANISEMFKEGFSTKGENRGIGLSTVRNIIDNNYSNILLNTFNENGLFKQELNIKKNKKMAA